MLNWIIFISLVYIFARMLSDTSKEEIRTLNDRIKVKEQEYLKLIQNNEKENRILKNTISQLRGMR